MRVRDTIDVNMKERAFLVVDEVPRRYLRPGRHHAWAFGQKISVLRFALSDLTVDLPPELRALVPVDDVHAVHVHDTERGVIMRKGRPVRVLPPGTYDLWTQVDVTIDIVDVSGVACAPLRDELRVFFVNKGYVDVTVPEGSVGLRFVDGRLDEVLPPGKHAAWSVEREVSFTCLDLRERILAIPAQEVMTKDKVTLRLNTSIIFRVEDPRRAATASKDADAALYLAAQLLLRDAVATHTLEELLARRELLSHGILEALRARGAELGLSINDVGVKDLVLPGEMRTLMNRVIEAQKEAEANVIARREETAATRSLAQTAKVLAENPLLVRLKELEAYKELASKVGTLHVVMGDGALHKLELKAQ